ncbi:MTAP family purine nucleoside phosphorylase [Methanolobus sp. ZRKC3]|uniref:MTAP family purine nucleoside phosphorylase n=1 Tax=Methanolobus sp. ZRKC3 TaxID=3125786 RepID=UPI003248F578
MQDSMNGLEEIPKFDIAIIGGVNSFFPECQNKISVDTHFGNVDVSIYEIAGRDVAVIPRHSDGGKHVPPHMINYRANVCAVSKLGVKRVISTNSVGTMDNHPIGSFVLADDFLDLTKNRTSTFYDHRTVHVDVSEPYCPEIKEGLKHSLRKMNIGFSEGVYVCTEGPRFESRAEIRMMSQFGDIVGMTGLPEVVLAKELNLCYASICTVTNNASGLSEGKLTVSEVLETLNATQEKLFAVLSDTIQKIPESRNCNCSHATLDACL